VCKHFGGQKQMPWRRENNSPSGLERAIAAFCYPSGGIVGIIYIIISRSSTQSDFFRFHFLQSIVLALLTLLVKWSFGALDMMVGPLVPGMIDLLAKMMSQDNANLVMSCLIQGLSSIFIVLALIGLYGFIMAALGKLAEIPLISKVVRQQMR
jgi:uncharacterized membrane protein